MAGTVNVKREPIRSKYTAKIIEKITIDWTSDASGNADSVISLFGYFFKGVTDPDGTAAPTDDYDISLMQNAVDMAGGVLQNRDTANNEIAYGIAKNGTDISSIPPFLVGDHTFTVANAGNAKSGQVILYISDTL